MTNKTIKLAPPAFGYKRKWIKCNKCGKEYFYDYIPYSLASPLLWLPCGHGVGQKLHKVSTEIDEPSWAKLARRRWQYHQRKVLNDERIA
jgi:hypothetical protein